MSLGSEHAKHICYQAGDTLLKKGTDGVKNGTKIVVRIKLRKVITFLKNLQNETIYHSTK